MAAISSAVKRAGKKKNCIASVDSEAALTQIRHGEVLPQMPFGPTCSGSGLFNVGLNWEGSVGFDLRDNGDALGADP